ncbi:MAG: nucleoside deaminase [Bacteroidetes bacterium]|nr:nucleoside deaminase [Bacteroidota bacterium]
MDYSSFMCKCIELAKKAKERGDSPVGSIVIRNNEIVGEGIVGGKTHHDITYHAEIEAIRDAVRKLNTNDLSDCSLITTHEPCILCSYVIRHYKINTVVMGLCVDEIGGYSSDFNILSTDAISKWQKAPVVITGVMKEECNLLHQK